MKNNERIFVQIAAYCDPDLIHTVRDLIKQAEKPDLIDICICWQHRKGEELHELPNLDNIEIIDVPHSETKGVCWARYQIQRRYKDQQYTLHLDSHHRFVRNWDTMLKEMHEQCKTVHDSKRPILTSYLPSFDPTNDPKGRDQSGPWCLQFDRFTPEGVVFMKNQLISDWESKNAPIRTRFFSAHFAFADGSFCKDVPHDPNYWFHGEEISIAARAFTHGYDLFCPHRVIAWHEYLREYRGPKVWDDQPKKTMERNMACHLRNRVLLGIDGMDIRKGPRIDFDKWGLGSKRHLREYELYAGIRFSDRSITSECQTNVEPLDPKDERIWEEKEFRRIFKHFIDIPIEIFKETDYNFVVIAFEDENGKEIYREDAPSAEISNLLTQSRTSGWAHVPLLREFHASAMPHKAIIWPHSESKGWCERTILNII